MLTAVITGASSGQGREFAKQISERYEEIEEIWLIARREDELKETAASIEAENSIKGNDTVRNKPFFHGDLCESGIAWRLKCRIISADLTKADALESYKRLLESEKPEISILVNAAGFGKFGSTESIPLIDLNDMIELNIKATVNMTMLTLPFMKLGSKIINMSSVSAFTPLPYFNIYAATKAFVLRFSRALGNELTEKGITVTAVCPYWVDTAFIPVARDVPQPLTVTNFMFIRQPAEVVRKALEDADCGKPVSLFGTVEYACRFLSKLFCDKVQMAAWNILRTLCG